MCDMQAYGQSVTLYAGDHQGYLAFWRMRLVVCKYGLNFAATIFLELFGQFSRHTNETVRITSTKHLQ